jgi:nucleotide-binding universal stress UspA family protein
VSILDGSLIGDVPAVLDEPGTLRILMAVESRADAHFASRRLRLLAVSHRCSVTLLGIAHVNLFVQGYAPLSGLTTPYRIALEAQKAADRLARTAAAEADVSGVDDIEAVVGWGSRRLIEPLRLGLYDALLLGSLPPRRLARRRLLAAACASGTRVLVGNR